MLGEIGHLQTLADDLHTLTLDPHKLPASSEQVGPAHFTCAPPRPQPSVEPHFTIVIINHTSWRCNKTPVSPIPPTHRRQHAIQSEAAPPFFTRAPPTLSLSWSGDPGPEGLRLHLVLSDTTLLTKHHL